METVIKMSCSEWLREKLSDGELHLCEWIREDAKRSGFTKSELKQARVALGVRTFHQFDEDGETPNWFWYLER